MTARSAQAFFVSATLHLAVAALVLLLAYAAQRPTRDVPKIMELVAGAGDNYAATEAPALGSPDGSKLKVALPDIVPPAPVQPSPAKVEPEPVPISPAPETRHATPAAPAAKRPPNFLADLKRIEQKREKRLEAAYKKRQEAEEKRLKKEEAGKRVARIDAEGIREGVVGGSTANKTGGAGGKALSREEGELIDAYFALLKSKIKGNLVPPEGASDSLVAKVAFHLSADGSISSVRIVKSSGNREYDEAVIEAVSHASAGPRPDGESDDISLEIKVHDDEAP
jgi:TonB family protein